MNETFLLFLIIEIMHFINSILIDDFKKLCAIPEIYFVKKSVLIYLISIPIGLGQG